MTTETIDKVTHHVVEGTNTKIKNLKHTGYGYPNFQHSKYQILIASNLTTTTEFEPRPLLFDTEDERRQSEQAKKAKQHEPMTVS